MRATAIAHSNIALVKYWGKRTDAPPALNLPAVGSLSVSHEARETHNNFPTAAGLASSASGFAALAVAGARAAGLKLSVSELSSLARQGSGSAARSLFGGFVEISAGISADGHDCITRQVAPETHWPLELVVAVTTRGPKATSSGEGMTRTADTSPFYPAWLKTHAADIAEARAAVRARDFSRLSRVTEQSCLKMHATMLGATPWILYWNPATIVAIEVVRGLQRAGVPVCFTIDAGPHVKALCLPEATDRVAVALEACPGVDSIIRSRLGPGAHLCEQ